MAERLSPVCAPALLAEEPGLKTPGDLLRHTVLLSFSKDPFEWTSWSHAAGLDLAGAHKRLLHDYNIGLQAALEGQGVAMGRLVLIQEKLRDGSLVQVFEQVVSGDIGHYLVTAPGPRAAHVQAFMDWIVAAAAEDQ